MTDQNNAIPFELERWPGYTEQSWPERFAVLDRLYADTINIVNGMAQQNAALRTPAPAPVGGDVVERLAYGYELMHQAICHMAGTSGGDARWYHDKAKDVFERVSPVFKITSESNAHTPGDCLSGYKTLFAALQAQPTASTAQPVYGDPFDPETDGTDCPSCGGQNISCPDGCGRDPESGELNGTRLETAQPDDVVERVAFAIIEGSAGTRAAEHAKEFQTANWTDALRSARAALAAMQQQAPVADDVRELVAKLRKPWFTHGCEEYQRKAADMLERLSTQPQPDAAVAVERERCAKVADGFVLPDMPGRAAVHISETSSTIAAAIRAGGQQP